MILTSTHLPIFVGAALSLKDAASGEAPYTLDVSAVLDEAARLTGEKLKSHVSKEYREAQVEVTVTPDGRFLFNFSLAAVEGATRDVTEGFVYHPDSGLGYPVMTKSSRVSDVSAGAMSTGQIGELDALQKRGLIVANYSHAQSDTPVAQCIVEKKISGQSLDAEAMRDVSLADLSMANPLMRFQRMYDEYLQLISAGILHGDYKAANLIVSADSGQLVPTDFELSHTDATLPLPTVRLKNFLESHPLAALNPSQWCDSTAFNKAVMQTFLTTQLGCPEADATAMTADLAHLKAYIASQPADTLIDQLFSSADTKQSFITRLSEYTKHLTYLGDPFLTELITELSLPTEDFIRTSGEQTYILPSQVKTLNALILEKPDVLFNQMVKHFPEHTKLAAFAYSLPTDAIDYDIQAAFNAFKRGEAVMLPRSVKERLKSDQLSLAREASNLLTELPECFASAPTALSEESKAQLSEQLYRLNPQGWTRTLETLQTPTAEFRALAASLDEYLYERAPSDTRQGIAQLSADRLAQLLVDGDLPEGIRQGLVNRFKSDCDMLATTLITDSTLPEAFDCFDTLSDIARTIHRQKQVAHSELTGGVEPLDPHTQALQLLTSQLNAQVSYLVPAPSRFPTPSEFVAELEQFYEALANGATQLTPMELYSLSRSFADLISSLPAEITENLSHPVQHLRQVHSQSTLVTEGTAADTAMQFDTTDFRFMQPKTWVGEDGFNQALLLIAFLEAASERGEYLMGTPRPYDILYNESTGEWRFSEFAPVVSQEDYYNHALFKTNGHHQVRYPTGDSEQDQLVAQTANTLYAKSVMSGLAAKRITSGAPSFVSELFKQWSSSLTWFDGTFNLYDCNLRGLRLGLQQIRELESHCETVSEKIAHCTLNQDIFPGLGAAFEEFKTYHQKESWQDTQSPMAEYLYKLKLKHALFGPDSQLTWKRWSRYQTVMANLFLLASNIEALALDDSAKAVLAEKLNTLLLRMSGYHKTSRWLYESENPALRIFDDEACVLNTTGLLTALESAESSEAATAIQKNIQFLEAWSYELAPVYTADDERALDWGGVAETVEAVEEHAFIPRLAEILRRLPESEQSTVSGRYLDINALSELILCCGEASDIADWFALSLPNGGVYFDESRTFFVDESSATRTTLVEKAYPVNPLRLIDVETGETHLGVCSTNREALDSYQQRQIKAVADQFEPPVPLEESSLGFLMVGPAIVNWHHQFGESPAIKFGELPADAHLQTVLTTLIDATQELATTTLALANFKDKQLIVPERALERRPFITDKGLPVTQDMALLQDFEQYKSGSNADRGRASDALSSWSSRMMTESQFERGVFRRTQMNSLDLLEVPLEKIISSLERLVTDSESTELMFNLTHIFTLLNNHYTQAIQEFNQLFDSLRPLQIKKQQLEVEIHALRGSDADQAALEAKVLALSTHQSKLDTIYDEGYQRASGVLNEFNGQLQTLSLLLKYGHDARALHTAQSKRPPNLVEINQLTESLLTVITSLKATYGTGITNLIDQTDLVRSDFMSHWCHLVYMLMRTPDILPRLSQQTRATQAVHSGAGMAEMPDFAASSTRINALMVESVFKNFKKELIGLLASDEPISPLFQQQNFAADAGLNEALDALQIELLHLSSFDNQKLQRWFDKNQDKPENPHLFKSLMMRQGSDSQFFTHFMAELDKSMTKIMLGLYALPDAKQEMTFKGYLGAIYARLQGKPVVSTQLTPKRLLERLQTMTEMVQFVNQGVYSTVIDESLPDQSTEALVTETQSKLRQAFDATDMPQRRKRVMDRETPLPRKRALVMSTLAASDDSDHDAAESPVSDPGQTTLPRDKPSAG